MTQIQQWKTGISQSLIQIERKAQKLLGFCCDPCCQHRWTFTYVKDLQWGHRHLGYIKQLSFHLGSALMGCCRDTVLFHAFHLFILVVLFLLKKKKNKLLSDCLKFQVTPSLHSSLITLGKGKHRNKAAGIESPYLFQ